jgi:hypothetical protein
MGFGKKSAPAEPIALPQRRELKACSLADLAVSTTLGTGTFGRVRVCQWADGSGADGGYYALKMLKKSEIIRLKQVDHIKSEIHLLSRIENPFIVNLIAKFQDPKMCYLVIEYINGGELFTHLRKAGRFTNVVGMYYGAEIAGALNYLHCMRVVYRDLKPENLLIVGNTGHIKPVKKNGERRHPHPPCTGLYLTFRLCCNALLLFQDHRFRLRQVYRGPHMDAVRHARVPRPGDHPKQGPQFRR